MEYHRIRRSIPERAAGFAPVTLELADARHRDGMSCENPAAYNYDANGHQRWCIDCGKELGEQAWASGGADVPPQFIGAVIYMVGLIGLMLLVLLGVSMASHNPDPASTPTTYNQPR
jgi:hypothetical protein